MDFSDPASRFNAPSSVSWRRIHGSVAHQLAVLIIGGKLAPGEVLPNEETLSAQLSVSRTAYREAMRILVAKGLVTSRPKVGTVVSPRASWNLLDPDVLSWHFDVAPSPSFIVSLFELRRIIEPANAALAAERRSDDDLAALHAAMAQMQASKSDTIAALEADLAFHGALLNASRNESLAALSSVISSTLRWTVRLKLDTQPRILEASLPLHVAVLEAVEAQDAEAASAHMSELVDRALAETLESLSSLAATQG